MTTDNTNPFADVQAQAEGIVAGGGEIRQRLRDAVAWAAEKSQQSGRGLVSLTQSVLDGARQGLEKATPPQPDDVLRQVVDALADGISQTALAARLAVEEARGEGRHFAHEDLSRLLDDLQAINALFTESVSRALTGCRVMTAGQVSGVLTHASRAGERMGRTVAAVLDAVRRDPVKLGKEGLLAGVSTGRHAAGALFGALGRMLSSAGERLRRDPDGLS